MGRTFRENGLRRISEEDVPYHFDPHRAFSAPKTVAFWGCVGLVSIRSRENHYEAACQPASCLGHQLRRVLVDTDRETVGLANYVDEALEQCGISHAFDNATHIPIARTSAISMSNGNLQADGYSEDSQGVRVRAGNPREVRDVSRGSRISIPGRPKCIQMDEEGESENGIRADFCSGRRIKLRFRGVVARPRLRKRRYGHARDF